MAQKLCYRNSINSTRTGQRQKHWPEGTICRSGGLVWTKTQISAPGMSSLPRTTVRFTNRSFTALEMAFTTISETPFGLHQSFWRQDYPDCCCWLPLKLDRRSLPQQLVYPFYCDWIVMYHVCSVQDARSIAATYNGPCFVRMEFEILLLKNGFKHITLAPYPPATKDLFAKQAVQNGEAGAQEEKKRKDGNKISQILVGVVHHTTEYNWWVTCTTAAKTRDSYMTELTQARCCWTHRASPTSTESCSW